MLRSLVKVLEFNVNTADGELGGVDDFLFDHKQWTVRYLVIDSDERLDRQRVYLSTVTIGGVDVSSHTMQVNLSLEAIKNSPDIGAGKIISRAHEVQLHNYYQWPFYWKPGDEGGIGPGNLAAIPLIELASSVEEQMPAGTKPDPENLRSFSETTGYTLSARDGEIGRVVDFLIDDDNWNILFMVVDTGDWLAGRKVLVSPSWVGEVDWLESHVSVDLLRETIRNSPEYDPNAPFNIEDASRLPDDYQQE